MTIKYRLKPYVILIKLNDGSLKFCSTYGRAFILPVEYAKLFEIYSDYIFLEMRESEKTLPNAISKKLELLRQDLLNVGIIEKSQPLIAVIPERYKSQMTFFSIFDGKNALRFRYHQKLSNSKIAILGIGGIGCHVAISLASSGIGFF